VPLDLLIFVIQFSLGILVYGIFAWIFFLPRLNQLPRIRQLMILTAPHAFRYLGLYAFTQAGYNSQISQAWANSTAWGDFAAHVFAVISLISLKKGWSFAIPFVWLCHLAGSYAFVDSTLKMIQTNVPVHALNAGWFLPVFYVPVLVWTNIFAYKRLLSRP